MRRIPPLLVLGLTLGPLLAACSMDRHRAPDLTVPPVYEAPPAQPHPTATARLGEGGAARTSQTAQPFPRGALQGSASRRHTEDLTSGSNNLIPVGGDTTSETLNFNVSWELDLFGRLATTRKVANADLA